MPRVLFQPPDVSDVAYVKGQPTEATAASQLLKAASSSPRHHHFIWPEQRHTHPSASTGPVLPAAPAVVYSYTDEETDVPTSARDH